MPPRPNRLLLPGAVVRWARIEAAGEDARLTSTQSLEDRLRRGQRLSAQAAALRRAVTHGDGRAA